MSDTLSEDWKRQQLGELIGRFDAGVSVNSEDRSARNDELGVLKISAVTEGRFRAEENKLILPGERNRARVNPKSDRIIMSRANTLELVGATAYVDTDYPNLFLSDKLWQLEPVSNADFEMRWLAYVLAAPAFRKRLRQIATGTSESMKNISQESVMSIDFYVPPRCEQVQVVEIMSAWDDAIEKLERLTVLRRQQGLWLSQRINDAPGSSTRLSKILTPVTRPLPTPKTSYWALGIRSHGVGTFRRFVEDPKTVAMEQVYAVRRNDLILNITFAWEGAIALVDQEDEQCLVSHRFPTYVIDHDKAIPHFLKHVVTRREFFKKLASISPGGAGRNRVLNKKDLLQLDVLLPTLEEQQRFADMLLTFDEHARYELRQLQAIKAQKQALIQKLITGKWRISVLHKREGG